MRVLFVNHTGARSGAEMSLVDLITALPDDVTALAACPEGELAADLRARGVDVHPIPAVDASFRLHPRHTLGGIIQTLRSARAVRTVARRQRSDIVHANSVRAGLAALIASAGGGPAVIVHVRDCLPANRTGRAIRALISRGAAEILANSRYTAQNFHGDVSGKATVAYSPIDLERFDAQRTDSSRIRSELGLGAATSLAVVAQITPWKGQDTAIEALALLKQRGVDARLLLVGSVKFANAATRHDNTAYLEYLRRLVAERGIEDDVVFTGERADIPAVLQATDVVLVPSWEEPFGRTVVEAMAMGTPVIATSVGGPAEMIDDGINGRLVEPRAADGWARAIEELIGDPALRTNMGEAGRKTVSRFDRHLHAEHVMAAYRRILAER